MAIETYSHGRRTPSERRCTPAQGHGMERGDGGAKDEGSQQSIAMQWVCCVLCEVLRLQVKEAARRTWDSVVRGQLWWFSRGPSLSSKAGVH